jgi:hypothetical protein
MQDVASKAEQYRKEANKYGELARNAQPAYLGDVYRSRRTVPVHGGRFIETARSPPGSCPESIG